MNTLRLLLIAIMASSAFTSCKKSETTIPVNKSAIKSGIIKLGAVPCEGDTAKEGAKYTANEQAAGIAVDGSGNVYSTTVSWQGLNLQKYTATGSLAWTTTVVATVPGSNGYYFGNYSNGEGLGYYSLPTLMTDKGGNVYLLYTRTDVFQLFTKNGDYENIIVNKYNPAGTLLGTLVQPVGKLNGPGFDSIKTVAAMRLDDEGNGYLCGNYDAGGFSPAVVNFDPRGTHTLTGAGSFILKINSNGGFVSVTKINAKLQHIALSNNGDVFDTGIALNNGTNGYARAFDSNGNQLWSKSLQGYDPDFITADDDGNAIITEDGLYMGKISAAGSLQWHINALPQSLPGPGTGYPIVGDIVMTTDENANIYIASDYFYLVYDVSGAYVNHSLLYIQKYDAGGNLVWSRQKVYGTNTAVASLVSDGSSYLYASGSEIVPTGLSKIPMPVSYSGAYAARISQCY